MKMLGWFLILLVLAMVPAQAQVSGFDPRFIDIDGNVTVDDGNCVPSGSPCSDWLAKQQDNTLVGIVDGIGNNDSDILSPGSDLNPGSMLPKQDITRAWISNNSQYLYVAEERRANNGNSGYHLFMTRLAPTAIQGQPVIYHLQNGDLEVRICFPKGSDPAGKSIEVTQVVGLDGILDVAAADIWTSGAFQPAPGAVVAFEVNTAVVPSLVGAYDSKGETATTYDISCFAEAAISLAALGLDPCGSRAYVSVITRSSCSLTSDVKDFAVPLLYSFGGPVVTKPKVQAGCTNVVSIEATASEGIAPYTFKGYDVVDGVETLIREITYPGPGPVTDKFDCVLGNGEHAIHVVVTDQNCCPADDTSDEFTIYESMGISLDVDVDCSNTATMESTITWGLAPYTVKWYDKVDGTETLIHEATVPGPAPAATTYIQALTPGDHTLRVVATGANGCEVEQSAGPFKVFDLLEVTLTEIADCPGHVTWTASPAGGDGEYTYEWKVDGVSVPGSSATYEYGPTADCNEHTVGVTITDGRGCKKSDLKTIKQVVNTTTL